MKPSLNGMHVRFIINKKVSAALHLPPWRPRNDWHIICEHKAYFCIIMIFIEDEIEADVRILLG